MNLLIVSHTPHYRDDSAIVGWGATVREIDHLASLFDRVTHLAPLHPEKAPASSLPYTTKNIRFRAVSPAGGDTFSARLRVLRCIPDYIYAIWQEIKIADVVHVRCPAAISLVALLLLVFIKKPVYRWVKYAGNWKPEGKSPFTYRLQRWLIARNVFRGVATINGSWKGQPRHIHSFYNPCLTEDELLEGKNLTRRFTTPYQILFAGRLERAKGVETVLQVAAELKKSEFSFETILIGDGPEREKYLKQAEAMRLEKTVRFEGWIPRNELGKYYSRAHFILLPSETEGWPKVLSEAMAYGVVILACNISSIPQILELTGSGLALDPQKPESYRSEIIGLVRNPERWEEFSQSGIRHASLFTYNYYLRSLSKLMQDSWGIDFSMNKDFSS